MKNCTVMIKSSRNKKMKLSKGWKTAGFLLIAFCGFFNSCSLQQKKAALLSAATEIDQLKQQVSELQYKVDQKDRELSKMRDVEKELGALIVQSYYKEDYASLFVYAGTFIKLFPESKNLDLYRSYYFSAVSELSDQKRLNDEIDVNDETGVWKVVQFGAGKPYLSTKERLAGTVNSTTQQDELAYMELMIFSESNIAFSLVDGDGATVLNGTKSKPELWEVTIKDGAGKLHTFKANCTNDRVQLTSGVSKQVNTYFQSGGYIQFTFKKNRSADNTVYRFNLQSAAFYTNGLRKLNAFTKNGAKE